MFKSKVFREYTHHTKHEGMLKYYCNPTQAYKTCQSANRDFSYLKGYHAIVNKRSWNIKWKENHAGDTNKIKNQDTLAYFYTLWLTMLICNSYREGITTLMITFKHFIVTILTI